jgi:hypothetical protein
MPVRRGCRAAAPTIDPTPATTGPAIASREEGCPNEQAWRRLANEGADAPFWRPAPHRPFGRRQRLSREVGKRPLAGVGRRLRGLVAARRHHRRTVGLILLLALAAVALGFGERMDLRCPGGERPFFPTGLAFGAGDQLYVTDALNGSVFRLDGEGCAAIGEGWSRPYGVAALADGRVCVGHLTSDDPLTREAAVSCWDGAAWTLIARGLASGVNGLAAGQGGLWVAWWQDTPVERRDGLLTLIADGEVVRRIELRARLPHFLVELPSGELWITVRLEGAEGITGGEVLRVLRDGAVVPAFASEHGRPSGIALGPGGIWIADDSTGDLVSYSLEGRRASRHSAGFVTPLGLVADQEGDLCVAESERGRVVCLDIRRLLGKEAHHEE